MTDFVSSKPEDPEGRQVLPLVYLADRMSWVPGFDNDVFLSYAEVDEATADHTLERGWVTQFHRHLEIALSRRAGRLGAVSVWRDSRALSGNDLFDQVIEEAIKKSAVFVALVSTGYLVSEYCSKELRTFFAKAQTDGGLVVGDRYRIFNVLLGDISSSKWLPEFGRTAGFTFHDAEKDLGGAEPTDPTSELFRGQMRRLAAALYDTLARMREHPTGSDAVSPGPEVFSTANTFRSRSQDEISKQDLPVATPNVFISYSHDSLHQKQRVLELANRLRADGIEAIIDQYEQTPIEGWPLWVEKRLGAADFVLIVCTEKYRELLEGSVKPKSGLGALWEGSLLYQHLYNAGSLNARLIPVLFNDASPDIIPVALRGSTWYRVDDPAGYQNLYRRLTSQPSILKPSPRSAADTRVAVPAKQFVPAIPLRVFLCHSSGDKPVVRSLYRRLLSEGISPWLDEENLVPGQLWEAEIAKAVRASDIVLICLSRSSITREGYVQRELRFALDVADEKPEGSLYLIPLRLEDCEVPERLRRWQWVDFFEESGYEKLIKAFGLHAAALGTSAQSPTSKTGVAPGLTRVLVSFAHKDEVYFKALERHLTLLQHQGIIGGWSGRIIEEYQVDEITAEVQIAGLILLLISPEYLAAEYCYSLEMQRAMERHQLRDAQVIPVIVRPCAWSLTPLSDLTPLPSGTLAISEWPSRDAALLDVTRGIRKAAQRRF